MSNQIPKLISVISGSDKLEACFKVSEIYNVSDVMNIDEKTIQHMEKFIQKKCSNIPLSERSKFLDDSLLNNPEMFMIPPGLTQRIINNCQKVSTIFENIPANDKNVAIVSNKLLKNSVKSNSAINLNMLENVLKSDRFYSLNQRQLCLTNSEHIPSPVIQRFSLDSRPRRNFVNNTDLNNSFPIPSSNLIQYQNREEEDKHSREISLNPPNIDDVLMETEFEISTNRTKNFIDKSIRIPINEPRQVAMKTELTTNVIPIPVNSITIKSEIANVTLESQTFRPNMKSPSKYRTPTKSRVNPIDYYYTKIVDDSSRMFYDCNLVPKIDFDVELNVKGKTETKPCAHFVCYTCQRTSKLKIEKRLKFYLTSKGAIINSNIINHLKIHFKLKGDV